MVRKLRKFTNPAAGDAGTRPNPRRYRPRRPNESFRQSNGAVSGDLYPPIWKTVVSATTAFIIGFRPAVLSASRKSRQFSQKRSLLKTDMLTRCALSRSKITYFYELRFSFVVHIDVALPSSSVVPGYHQPPLPLPSFYHHQVPSLILHLERGRLATPIDHYIDRPRREHHSRSSERRQLEELNTTNNSYNQQLKKTTTAITRTRTTPKGKQQQQLFERNSRGRDARTSSGGFLSTRKSETVRRAAAAAK